MRGIIHGKYQLSNVIIKIFDNVSLEMWGECLATERYLAHETQDILSRA